MLCAVVLYGNSRHTQKGIMQSSDKRAIRAVMLQRGITQRKLSDLTGLSIRTIEGCFTGNKPLLRTWRKIEFALGQPITCNKSDLQARNAIAQELGADPGTIPLRDLRKRAKPFGVRITKRSRSEIINSLTAKLAERKSDNERKQASG
ncbi:MAG: hypothetical protein A2283_22975 [Lentisphaerae bacterium RIFOXYA12_FULL_48_11]|nr:MAG: hypothetical protein A2283_22975 [Lentisphaerae bacterium RIFOXYA12_FULL_48_11]